MTRKERRTRNRELLRLIKLQRCIICKKHFPPEAIDLDHQTKKTRPISTLLDCSVRVLLTEVLLCEPACANCHRIRHAKERKKR